MELVVKCLKTVGKDRLWKNAPNYVKIHGVKDGTMYAFCGRLIRTVDEGWMIVSGTIEDIDCKICTFRKYKGYEKSS